MKDHTQNENSKSSKKPSHTVFSVKEVNGKDFWHTHGVAFEHANGQGMNVILNVLGMEFNLVILQNKDKE